MEKLLSPSLFYLSAAQSLFERIEPDSKMRPVDVVAAAIGGAAILHSVLLEAAALLGSSLAVLASANVGNVTRSNVSPQLSS